MATGAIEFGDDPRQPFHKTDDKLEPLTREYIRPGAKAAEAWHEFAKSIGEDKQPGRVFLCLLEAHRALWLGAI